MSAMGRSWTSLCSIPLILFLISLDQSREPQPLLCQVTESLFCECVRRTLCPLLAPGCILAVDLSRRWHRRASTAFDSVTLLFGLRLVRQSQFDCYARPVWPSADKHALSFQIRTYRRDHFRPAPTR